jgi:cell division septation protein DedD
LPQSFYINVGSFAVTANADAAYQRLLNAGLTATRQEIETKKGTLIRVRVGPFDSKPQADAVVETIHALKLDALVVRK